MPQYFGTFTLSSRSGRWGTGRTGSCSRRFAPGENRPSRLSRPWWNDTGRWSSTSAEEVCATLTTLKMRFRPPSWCSSAGRARCGCATLWAPGCTVLHVGSQVRRVSAARRQVHEGRAAARAARMMPGFSQGVESDEIVPRVHEELSRLPERYRAPLVLCYLEGPTHEQAAERLRCPVGTVRSRLARGREQLRSRLVRRGLAPSMSSIGIAFMKPIVPTLVPPAWVENTVGAAISLQAGGYASVAISASVLRLVKGVLAAMFLTKFKALGASFLIVSIIGFGAGVMARQDAP